MVAAAQANSLRDLLIHSRNRRIFFLNLGIGQIQRLIQDREPRDLFRLRAPLRRSVYDKDISARLNPARLSGLVAGTKLISAGRFKSNGSFLNTAAVGESLTNESGQPETAVSK